METTDNGKYTAITTVIEILDLQSQESVNKLKQAGDWYSNHSNNIVLIDDSTKNGALVFLKDCKNIISLLEGKRKTMVKPLNDQVCTINQFFKEIEANFQYAENKFRRLIVDYEDYLEFKRLEAEAETRRKVEEEQERLRRLTMVQGSVSEAVQQDSTNRIKLAEDEVKSLERPNTQILESGSTTLRKTWTFEVMNIGEVPREYLTLDRKVIMDAIIKKQITDIPGLKIFQITGIAIK
jgi:hypothetical protein